jgi:hypothetical protein
MLQKKLTGKIDKILQKFQEKYFEKEKPILKVNFASNSSRDYLENFVREAANFLPKGSLILDAGSGQSPYKSLFSEHCYESADFCQVGEITYVCDLTAIPVENNKYDLILLTQVIEWLEGYYETLSYQLNTAAKALPNHLKDYGGGKLFSIQIGYNSKDKVWKS